MATISLVQGQNGWDLPNTTLSQEQANAYLAANDIIEGNGWTRTRVTPERKAAIQAAMKVDPDTVTEEVEPIISTPQPRTPVQAQPGPTANVKWVKSPDGKSYIPQFQSETSAKAIRAAAPEGQHISNQASRHQAMLNRRTNQVAERQRKVDESLAKRNASNSFSDIEGVNTKGVNTKGASLIATNRLDRAKDWQENWQKKATNSGDRDAQVNEAAARLRTNTYIDDPPKSDGTLGKTAAQKRADDLDIVNARKTSDRRTKNIIKAVVRKY